MIHALRNDAGITLLPPASIDGTRGGMRLVANTAKGLAAQGCRVEVFTSVKSPYIVKNPNIRITACETSRARALIVPLIRHIKRRKPHMIMPYGIETMVVTAAAKAVCRSRVRLLPVFPDAAGVWIQSPKDRIVLSLARKAVRCIDSAVAGTREALRDVVRLLGISPDRVQVVYNPVIDADTFEQELNAPLDHPWFAAGEPPVILGAGQLIERKGFETLIRAFAILHRTHRARLILLGEGPQRPHLQNLVAESSLCGDVDFQGFVENPFPYFKRANVFVNPSLREGFPNALVEALAAGTPVVTTDCGGGHSEILQGNTWGQKVPKGDAPHLAKALVQALSSQPDSGMLKARALIFSTAQAARGYMAAASRFYSAA